MLSKVGFKTRDMKVTPGFYDPPTSFLKTGQIVAGRRQPERADFIINLLFSVRNYDYYELEFL